MSCDPTMYIFLNQGLAMTTGKAAAQAGHAAVEAYRITPPESNLVRLWYKGNHYKKIILLGRNQEHMGVIEKYLLERRFACVPIIDEGRTEVDTHVFTALGCAIVDKNEPHTDATFSSFSLYKDAPSRNSRFLFIK